jgi:hypothetical protein
MLADPGSDSRLSQVAPGLLALDPLETLSFFLTALMQTHPALGDEGDEG